jgi:hypothetical protein
MASGTTAEDFEDLDTPIDASLYPLDAIIETQWRNGSFALPIDSQRSWVNGDKSPVLVDSLV